MIERAVGAAALLFLIGVHGVIARCEVSEEARIEALLEQLESNDPEPREAAHRELLALDRVASVAVSRRYSRATSKMPNVRHLALLSELREVDDSVTELLRTALRADFGGIGAAIVVSHDGVYLHPLAESPAAKAGIKKEDRLFEVEGRSIEKMSRDEIVSAIRGRAGSGVRLKIAPIVSWTPTRYGKAKHVRIVREPIMEPVTVSLAAKTAAKMGERGRTLIPELTRAVFEGKHPQPINAGIDALFAIDPSSSSYAARCLERLDSKEGPVLGAILLLSRLGDEARGAAPRLLKALSQRDGEEEAEALRTALRSLASMDPRDETEIRSYLSHPNQSLRWTSLGLLSSLDSPDDETVSLILKMYSYETHVICDRLREVVPKMKRVDSKRIVEILGHVELAQSRHCAVRGLETIENLSSPSAEALPALLRLIRRRQWGLGDQAASLIGRMGDASLEAIPALVDVVEKDGNAKASASKALRSLGPRAREALARRIDEKAALGDTREIFWLFQAIGDHGSEAMPILSRYVESQQEDVRGAAVSQLARLGPISEAMARRVVKNFEHGGSGFGEMSFFVQAGSVAHPSLFRALDHGDSRVRERALRIISRLKLSDGRAIKAIRKRVDDPNDAVAIAAIELLGAIGPASDAAYPIIYKSMSVSNRAASALIALTRIRPNSETTRAAIHAALASQSEERQQAGLDAAALLGRDGEEFLPDIERYAASLGERGKAARVWARRALDHIATPRAREISDRYFK